jgi:hypothetical protein
VIGVWALPSAPIVKMLLSVGNPVRGLENASFPFAPGNAASDVAGDSAPSATANATSTNVRPARGVAPK